MKKCLFILCILLGIAAGLGASVGINLLMPYKLRDLTFVGMGLFVGSSVGGFSYLFFTQTKPLRKHWLLMNFGFFAGFGYDLVGFLWAVIYEATQNFFLSFASFVPIVPFGFYAYRLLREIQSEEYDQQQARLNQLHEKNIKSE
ncbi:membrane protein of unknown function (plasmid) [Pseudodesulfovibrio profundus]|uniref:Uncharacterized protein n=1 Tax=Pseudodesulfovibrio profundus TaxID=57320 RepID=A0A2C8FEY3_9BACT|nr:hypothetical protein [Pseudodesulfovibrio profundus]SOB62153.1 membrane protein of unknown function [Pseudodesulfovibrio profundus]